MSKKWNTADIPSQKGKIYVVTGANSGLGLGTTKVLAQKGAQVVMAVRNLEKGKAAMQEVLRETPDAQLELMQVDLSDLESVRLFAAEYRRKYDRLNVLINNAGVMMPVQRFETKQGYEGQFGTNHLGHFVLTRELYDVIDGTPDARIVTLSSLVAKMAKGKIYWDDLQWEQSYDKMGSYAQSKLANMMFGYELHQRLEEAGSGTQSILAHPGYTATNLQQHMGLQGRVMNFLFAQKLEMGILPTLRAATDRSAKGGEYYGPANMMNWRGHPVLNEPNPEALDRPTTQRMWDLTEQLTQTTFSIAK